MYKAREKQISGHIVGETLMSPQTDTVELQGNTGAAYDIALELRICLRAVMHKFHAWQTGALAYGVCLYWGCRG